MEVKPPQCRGSRKGPCPLLSRSRLARAAPAAGLTNTLCDSEDATGVSSTSRRTGWPARIDPDGRTSRHRRKTALERPGRAVRAAQGGDAGPRQPAGAPPPLSRRSTSRARSAPAHRGDPHPRRLDDLPPPHHARGDAGAAALRLGEADPGPAHPRRLGAPLHPHPLHALRRRLAPRSRLRGDRDRASGSTC